MNKIKHLEQCHSHEKNKSLNLALQNEQLQYKLKQNSEKMVMAITELSKRYHDQSDFLNETKASFYGQEASATESLKSQDMQCNGSFNLSTDFLPMDDLSPPTTPVIKGVVEKNESVSWILQINDEESAETLASRIVRRAGSFRSGLNDRQPLQQVHTPAKKRQLSASSNPLSQSASTASILRQYSSDTSPVFQNHVSKSRPKSASTSKTNGQRQTQRERFQPTAQWPSSSSPKMHHSPRRQMSENITTTTTDLLMSEESEIENSPKTRTRSNSFTDDCTTGRQYFRRHNSYKPSKRSALITCSTATLTSPRAELLSVVGTTSTQQDSTTKQQQIKESAGEAMVSGTNSEDESSIGSSDESMSIASSSTNSTHSHRSGGGGGRSGDEMIVRSHSSIGNELMQKIVASLGGDTPIDGSWPEDCCDQDYSNESVV